MKSLSTSSKVVLRVSRPESASMLPFLEKFLLEQDPIRSYDRVWYGMHDEGSWHLSKFNTWSKVALRVSRARFQSLRWRHQYPQSTLSHPIQQLIKSTNIPEDGSIHGFIGYGVHIKGSAGQFKRGSLFTLRDQDNNSFLQIETIPQTTRKIYLSGINALIATISCVSEI